MPKVKIRVTITSSEVTTSSELNALKTENTISYIDNEKTMTSYNFLKNTFTRENAELKMQYHFLENKITTGKIILKELKKNIEIPLQTISIIKNANFYQITYIIDHEEFIYKIEVIK